MVYQVTTSKGLLQCVVYITNVQREIVEASSIRCRARLSSHVNNRVPKDNRFGPGVRRGLVEQEGRNE